MCLQEFGRCLLWSEISFNEAKQSFENCKTDDGYTLPFADASFDAVLLVDVLHHAEDAEAVLREAARVAPGCVVVKDHTPAGALDYRQLALMDWWANRSFGYDLNFAYLRWNEWQQLFAASALAAQRIERKLGLYPAPFGWAFDRGLHFIAQLERSA